MTVTTNFDFVNREMEFHDSEMVRFIRNEQGKKKKENTVYTYANGLEEFSKWLDQEGISPLDVDFVDLGNYMTYLMNDRGLANSTAETKFSPINLYYKYLIKLKKIDENPTDNFDAGDYIEWDRTKTKEVRGDERVHLTKEELEKIVEGCPAPKLRNRLLLQFIYYTGLRVSEAVNVKLEDLDRKERLVRVSAKGDKEHTGVWQEDLDGLMTQWLDYGYRDSYPTADDSPYLFITARSEHISVRRVNGILDEAASNAGIQEIIFTDARGRKFKKVTPHKLRHSFAMHFLNDGGSIEALSNRLAHSSIITTEIYGQVEDERGIDEYNTFMQPLQTSSEIESDQCKLCGKATTLESHHTSYSPERTIDICRQCHLRLHDKEEPKELIPDMSRKEAEEKGYIS